MIIDVSSIKTKAIKVLKIDVKPKSDPIDVFI